MHQPAGRTVQCWFVCISGTENSSYRRYAQGATRGHCYFCHFLSSDGVSVAAAGEMLPPVVSEVLNLEKTLQTGRLVLKRRRRLFLCSERFNVQLLFSHEGWGWDFNEQKVILFCFLFTDISFQTYCCDVNKSFSYPNVCVLFFCFCRNVIIRRWRNRIVHLSSS